MGHLKKLGDAAGVGKNIKNGKKKPAGNHHKLGFFTCVSMVIKHDITTYESRAYFIRFQHQKVEWRCDEIYSENVSRHGDSRGEREEQQLNI